MSTCLTSRLAATPMRVSRRPLPVRANLTTDVPPNVKEARDWIAAWKASQGHTPAASVIAPANGSENLAASNGTQAQPPEMAAAAHPPQEPVLAADGSLTFSKDLLDSFSYEDMISRMRQKVDMQ
ncbi:hypothetical protein Agub_g13956 [Astrephomene gubernaculifera]|uniref:Uncharacterized protein n=1 Tax=Astrephomene gubernaculifera TaxID=47775 RepID=A0AAD3E133_9CHLO|nr:hypothetical protein Agub_g13956 [Astrephomene gubernaculifera]